MAMELRPYQQEAKTAIQAEWAQGRRRTLLVLPTGCGKTIVFSKQLQEMRTRKRRLVDPLHFEMSIQAEDLTGYVPAFGWEMGPPSQKQMQALERMGIFPDSVECAGKAAKLLDRLDKRRMEGLTTPKQIRFLEGRGFQHVGTWQFQDAKRLIDRIAANGWRVPNGIRPGEYVPEAIPARAEFGEVASW